MHGKRLLTIEPAPAPRTLVVEVLRGAKAQKVRYEGRRIEVGF